MLTDKEPNAGTGSMANNEPVNRRVPRCAPRIRDTTARVAVSAAGNEGDGKALNTEAASRRQTDTRPGTHDDQQSAGHQTAAASARIRSRAGCTSRIRSAPSPAYSAMASRLPVMVFVGRANA